tara:strand:- start:3340 stop:4872 length:1533 start_codon:yes stop_codon:yes gene_type:complete
MALIERRTTEIEAQTMWYNLLKPFGYSRIQAFPLSGQSGTDRVRKGSKGTLLYRVFKPEKIFAISHGFIHDGTYIPITTRCYGVINQGVIFLGLQSMEERLKGKPLKNSARTSNTDKDSKRITVSGFANKVKDSYGDKDIDWGVNPKQSSIPWPKEYTNYEATAEELSDWLDNRYPAFNTSKFLESVEMVGDKKEMYNLVRRSFRGDKVELSLSTVSDDAFKGKYQFANLTNPNIREYLKTKHGFEYLEIPRDDAEQVAFMLDFPEPIQEAIMLLEDETSKGLMIKMPKPQNVKKSEWQYILKIFDRGDDKKKDKDPDNEKAIQNPKWARVIRGSGGRKTDFKEHYKRRMKPNMSSPCEDEIKEIIFRIAETEVGDWTDSSRYEMRRELENMSKTQIGDTIENEYVFNFRDAEIPIRKVFTPDEAQEMGLGKDMENKSIYDKYMSCIKLVTSWTDTLKPDSTSASRGGVPSGADLSRTEKQREAFRDWKEQQTGKKVERWGEWDSLEEEE